MNQVHCTLMMKMKWKLWRKAVELWCRDWFLTVWEVWWWDLFQCEPISGLGFRRGSYNCVCIKVRTGAASINSECWLLCRGFTSQTRPPQRNITTAPSWRRSTRWSWRWAVTISHMLTCGKMNLSTVRELRLAEWLDLNCQNTIQIQPSC